MLQKEEINKTMKIHPDIKKLITPDELMLSDPLRNETRLIKRNLLIFSSITLVAVAFGSESVQHPLNKLPSEALLGALCCVSVYFGISFISSYVWDVQSWFSAKRNLIGSEQIEELRTLTEWVTLYKNQMLVLAHNIDHHQIRYREELEALLSPIKETLKNLEKIPEKQNIKDILENTSVLIKRYALPRSGKETAISQVHQRTYEEKFDELCEALVTFEAMQKIHLKKLKTIQRETWQLKLMQYFKVFIWDGILPLIISSLAIKNTFINLFDFIDKLI